MIDADVSANPRAERWQQYLDDLHAYASVPLPLHTQGTLVRVAGLVMEAAGVRAPVGSVFEVHGESTAPVLAMAWLLRPAMRIAEAAGPTGVATSIATAKATSAPRAWTTSGPNTVSSGVGNRAMSV